MEQPLDPPKDCAPKPPVGGDLDLRAGGAELLLTDAGPAHNRWGPARMRPTPEAMALENGAEVIARSRSVQLAVESSRPRWVALAVAVRERCGAQRLNGGSDAVPIQDVATTISGVSLCTTCIASKLSVSLQQLDMAMIALERQRSVALTFAPCNGCQRERLLYRIP